MLGTIDEGAEGKTAAAPKADPAPAKAEPAAAPAKAAPAEKPKADLEALPAPPVEMDEAEMLKALQNDRDGAPDGRI